MSAGATESINAALVVAADIDTSVLGDLVGDLGAFTEDEMGVHSSRLSELECEAVEVDEDTGRPNFKRATHCAGKIRSTQEFFRRGIHNGLSNKGLRNNSLRNNGLSDDIFDASGKTTRRGALARSFAAAASSSQQQAETLNSAKSSGEGENGLVFFVESHSHGAYRDYGGVNF